MLRTTLNSLKWLRNLTRHYQGGKTAATLTEIERCLLHRKGPRLGPQITAVKTFRVWCTGNRSPRPGHLALDASDHPVGSMQRWGRPQAPATSRGAACSGSQLSPSPSATTRGLSSGLRASLIRALGPWVPSRSIWWTTTTPSYGMGIGLLG